MAAFVFANTTGRAPIEGADEFLTRTPLQLSQVSREARRACSQYTCE